MCWGKAAQASFFQTSCLTGFPTRGATVVSDWWCNVSPQGVLLQAEVIFCNISDVSPQKKFEEPFLVLTCLKWFSPSLLFSPLEVHSGETDNRSQPGFIDSLWSSEKAGAPSMWLFIYRVVYLIKWNYHSSLWYKLRLEGGFFCLFTTLIWTWVYLFFFFIWESFLNSIQTFLLLLLLSAL